MIIASLTGCFVSSCPSAMQWCDVALLLELVMSDLIKASIAFIKAVVRYFKAIVAGYRAINKLSEAIIELQSSNRCHDPEFRAEFKRLTKKAGIQ